MNLQVFLLLRTDSAPESRLARSLAAADAVALELTSESPVSRLPTPAVILWDFPKIWVPYVEVLRIRILLFRVLY